MMEELGSGEFGVVFKGQLLENGESKECAVKTLKSKFSNDSSLLAQKLVLRKKSDG